METDVLRLAEPRELLALVPHLLGFHPHDSAVVVSLRGARGRLGVVARVDLDDVADQRHGPQVARSLATHLDRDGARRAVLVVYADPGVPGASGRVQAAASHVAEAFDVPFGGVDVLLVGGGGYRCLDCDEACCPPDGHPLDDLRSTRANAEMVLAGSVVAPSRGAVARIPAAPEPARRAAARARRRRAATHAKAVATGPDAVARWRLEQLALWRRLVAGATAAPGVGPAPALLGRLEAGLADRRVRDAVLVALLPGTGTLAERALTRAGLDEDGEVRDAVGRLVDPATADAPGDDVRPAESVLEAVVAHGRRRGQAPALTLLGLLAWWRGDGARGGLLVDRALTDEPDYRLARLLRGALDAGLAPGWVTRGR
jgi:hypothetical protein